MKNLIAFSLLLFLGLFNLQAQNGKILQKKKIDLKNKPIWNKITENDTLLPRFAHFDSLNIYLIKYESDAIPVMGLYLEPKREGKFPVVIYNRGGNRDFSQLSIPSMLVSNGKLAAEGYVVIASNYRKEDEFGGAELNDVLNLFETINEIDKADTSKIGMFGWSRGGMMTYLTLKNTCKIKSAIVGNGPTDLFAECKYRPKMETMVYAECIPNYEENKEEELKKRSVIHWADELCKSTSLLIFSGTEDKRVDPKQIDFLDKKLKKLGYTYEIQKHKTDHAFSGKKDVLFKEVIEWFNKTLKD